VVTSFFRPQSVAFTETNLMAAKVAGTFHVPQPLPNFPGEAEDVEQK